MSGKAIWLLPLAFAVHDAEELATRNAWLARHGETLHGMLQRYLGLEAVASLAPTTLAVTALAMASLLWSSSRLPPGCG
jgi:hypothetical protein